MIIDVNYAFKIRLMTEMGGNLTQVEILFKVYFVTANQWFMIVTAEQWHHQINVLTLKTKSKLKA